MTAPDPMYNRIARFIAKRCSVSGLEHVPKNGPFVVIANHQSYFDPPLLAGIVATGFGTKLQFLTTEYVINFIRRCFGTKTPIWLGMLPVDNRQPGDSLLPAHNHLMQKGLIGVFPEGRRNSTSTLLPGKTGAVRLALAAHCPIVPVGIRLPATGGRFFFSWLLGLNRPAFVFGSPISFNAENERPVTKTQLVEHTNDIMRAIDRLSGKSFTERS